MTNRSAARARWVYPRVGGETHCLLLSRLGPSGLSPRGRGNQPPAWVGGLTGGSIPAWAGKPPALLCGGWLIWVYPRVGGETYEDHPDMIRFSGLSPRGRGNRLPWYPELPLLRSIPAWAGKPEPEAGTSEPTEVYPRVGGETGALGFECRLILGLSPRGRGNPGRAPAAGGGVGSIPAWAGKPRSSIRTECRSRVYPRVGGETKDTRSAVSVALGLSPRGRGNHAGAWSAGRIGGSIPAWAGKPPQRLRSTPTTRVYPRVGGETSSCQGSGAQVKGLSPRGRGNPGTPDTVATYTRSIPAWAGKPTRLTRLRVRPRVYPRVGGETMLAPSWTGARPGLSPRGRGNRWGRCGRIRSPGSIPAWAGKPCLVVCRQRAWAVYPRVGGETRSSLDGHPVDVGLSPRGRGNLPSRSICPGRPGSIPAWAGKPTCFGLRSMRSGVYPRVGGETGRSGEFEPIGEGLSPRGRGNLGISNAKMRSCGSIPAWAGKPVCGLGVRRSLRVYPRVGGETTCTASQPRARPGLSPRGRGNHANINPSAVVWRSIPAWAGKPAHLSPERTAPRVYPRVGGETLRCRLTVRRHKSVPERGRSIPAWAGKPRRRRKKAHPVEVYPRVGGETPQWNQDQEIAQGLSPRGRGNLHV